jgi:hypothetical protein
MFIACIYLNIFPYLWLIFDHFYDSVIVQLAEILHILNEELFHLLSEISAPYLKIYPYVVI